MSALSNTSPSRSLWREWRLAWSVVPDQRPGFLLTLLVWFSAAALCLAFAVQAFQMRGRPFFGAMLTPFLVVDGSQSVNPRPWPALAAGLQPLDRVVAINGQPMSLTPGDVAEARQRFLDFMSRVRPGDRLEVEIERPTDAPVVRGQRTIVCAAPQDGIARCRAAYWVIPLPPNDFTAHFLIPAGAAVLALLLSGALLALRPNQALARIIALTGAVAAVLLAGSFSAHTTYTLTPVWLVAVSFLSGTIGMLALTFPVKLTLLYRRPGLLYLPALMSGILAVVVVLAYQNPTSPWAFPLLWQVGMYAAAAAALVLTFSLLRRRAIATSTLVRDQCNTGLIGLAMIILPALLWAVNNLLMLITYRTLIPLTSAAVMPFIILPIASFAYAVLQYRIVDTDKVISQAITYSLLLGALIIGYFLVVFGSTLVTRSTLQMAASDPLLVALTVFVMAVLFLPLRTYLQNRIDRIYFRTRADYQQRVEAFARELTSLAELDQIIEAFQRQLRETIAPVSAFVFLLNRDTGSYMTVGGEAYRTDIRFSADSSLLKLLNDPQQEDLIHLEPNRPWPLELRDERARLSILRTLVIARLRGRKQLIGFVSISPPRSGSRVYRFEELRFIQNLTNQMAISVERAQAIDALERRVRELDVLSQVSQAANFTLEFDDLLELISAQTGKLIDSPHFYIVLREAATDKLYFAFFSEDYERFRDCENRRWLLGRDLFSEVVRSGAPLRVEDYAAAMAHRSAPIIYEDPQLKAWMGVPMIVGSNTLGMLAAGSPQADQKFTDDQLRIFGDIGSLAATSIEKARLFAETNLRARQLSALNDISRRLASELHVESLLELITASAVDILDAEAGSLLLVVDDETRDLEFKVAVGSGQELVGSRFPAKRGLVGEVASTGKGVIVNDAANDPRWGGEVAKGSFSTTAVLAVPLIAQKQVIGVLEVINKKGGGAYVQEDLELLATFAAQAAIAIENARLFEMTDMQLSKRVAELQALERIDVELNRSLDLQRVADVTMRWAIANTGATAGALGLVVGDPPMLQILSRHGYEPEDFPPGADGQLWPLDRGIVSRVMRTRQPDIATDVTIDPNYIPSLRGSKSQITVPMMSGGEIHALLVLEKDTEPRLNLIDLAFVQRLAEHAIIAITNAQFYAEMTRANEWKSEFVSFVAHELKTPMTSMKGYTDLLISGVTGALSEQQQAFLGTIRANIDRMQTLVSDLNDVTKLQTKKMPMEFQPLDFRAVVTESLRPLLRQIEEKHQTLTLDIPDTLPAILADQNRLIQVLTNLLSNAYKYTPPEGHITLRARVAETNRDGKGRDLGPALHVSVADTGIGMSEDDLKQLFTPYFRSDNPLAREQPGTGLGLTIVHGIIERHGGRIWVESQIGQGTTFNFTIPLAADAAAEPSESAPQPQAVN